MRYLFAILLAVLPFGAQAGPDRVNVMLGSHHVGLTAPRAVGGEFQEFNPGVVLVWEDRLGALDVSAGLFRNSFGSLAPVIAVSNDMEVRDDVRLGWFFGAAYYGDDARWVSESLADNGVVPFLGVQGSYKNVYVQAAPLKGDDGSLGYVLGYGLTFDLK